MRRAIATSEVPTEFRTQLNVGEEIVRLDNVMLHYHLDQQDPGRELGSEDWGGVPPILNDVTLSIGHGSFHFLTGSSGAGKSSLLKLLYLGMRPTQGLIRLFGQDVVNLSRAQLALVRRRIGIVFQDFNLIPHLTTLENVALPLQIAGARRRDVRDHVADLLTWVGLGARLDAYPATLSGGEQQRVAIARAVITKPGLLLADEPTGNVDDEMATRLLYLFEQLNKMGTTVMIATHNEALIQQFPYPTLRLDQGHISYV